MRDEPDVDCASVHLDAGSSKAAVNECDYAVVNLTSSFGEPSKLPLVSGSGKANLTDRLAGVALASCNASDSGEAARLASAFGKVLNESDGGFAGISSSLSSGEAIRFADCSADAASASNNANGSPHHFSGEVVDHGGVDSVSEQLLMSLQLLAVLVSACSLQPSETLSFFK